jgi:hypothetical protein
MSCSLFARRGEDMEAVEGLLKNLDLSEKEKRGILIERSATVGGSSKEPQAVGKVISEKAARVDVLEASLGKIWCPRSGMECRALGENMFLFIFLQASGKLRALEEGPWMLLNELIDMADYDGTKTIDEISFTHIPIWVRVTKMPLGMMNQWYGEAIGNQVGEFLEMEKEEDGSVVGQFLRIKVKLDIGKPLMRGVTLCGEDKDGGGKDIWCPLMYEFIPDFCYLCGIIGHTDKFCGNEERRSGTKQYSASLRFILPRRSFGDETHKASWRPCHLLGRGSTPAGKMHGGEGVLGGVRASIESSC